MASDPQLVESVRAALAARPEVYDGYLFGSVARGDTHAGSDVDVAVYVDDEVLRRPGFGYQPELGAELQSVLKRSDVDVVVLNRAPPLLYYRVLRDGIRLVSRDAAATTTREGRAFSRYFDYVPTAREDRSRASLEAEGGSMTPSKPDAALLRRHLLALDQALNRLERRASIPLEAYLADAELQWAVERGLLVCAQNLLDIAAHLGASGGLDSADYTSSIDGLATLGVVPQAFARA